MTSMSAFLANAPRLPGHYPWPCYSLDRVDWLTLRERLTQEPWCLKALWGLAEQSIAAGPALEGGQAPPFTGSPSPPTATPPGPPHGHVTGEVFMALFDPTATDPGQALAVISHYCPEGHYPAITPIRPGAYRMERSLWDLTGLVPLDMEDERPWLDHGAWPLLQPLGLAAPLPGSLHTTSGAFSTSETKTRYHFLDVAPYGDLHPDDITTFSSGPLQSALSESGQFHFHLHGETVLRCEARLGFKHKGLETLMAGRLPLDAVYFANRLSGDSAVSMAWAFSAALEAALGLSIPPRAQLLRALMAECERLANHFRAIGQSCHLAGAPLLHNECQALQEDILRAQDVCFSHRLLMDQVIPGGVRNDLTQAGRDHLRHMATAMVGRLEALLDSLDRNQGLKDRLRTVGPLSRHLVTLFGATGPVARASGLDHDARKHLPYAPYENFTFDSPYNHQAAAPEEDSYSDCYDRLWQRGMECRSSLALLRDILDQTPGAVTSPSLQTSMTSNVAHGSGLTGAILDFPDQGEIHHRLEGFAGEGFAVLEGFRGTISAWVRLSPDGTIARALLHDPSWLQWPLLEAAMAGQALSDFPLCKASFYGSYSGVDL